MDSIRIYPPSFAVKVIVTNYLTTKELCLWLVSSPNRLARAFTLSSNTLKPRFRWKKKTSGDDHLFPKTLQPCRPKAPPARPCTDCASQFYTKASKIFWIVKNTGGRAGRIPLNTSTTLLYLLLKTRRKGRDKLRKNWFSDFFLLPCTSRDFSMEKGKTEKAK